jgi:hypothetical protein
MPKLRRLVDVYRFPGFRPAAEIRGIYGDPKACVVTLKRRSKKRRVARAVVFIAAGTTGRFGAFAIFPAAIEESTWSWRSAASTAGAVAP